jgi:regulatory protein
MVSTKLKMNKHNKRVAQKIVKQLILNHQIDWYLQAQLAYNKHFGASLINDHKDRAKIIRFMLHRGFSTDEIMTRLNANTD